jgi:hypothetical protein
LIEQAQNSELKNLDMNTKKEEKEMLLEKKKYDGSYQSGPIPPLFEHVKIYFDEKGFPMVEAEKFYNYFESNGWLVGGRARMKDWKAASRNWILNIPKFAPKSKPHLPGSSHLNPSKNYGEPL